MSEDLLIRHCSPTLAGIKTGNLFSCACSSREELTKDLCRLNRKLVPRGIRVLPLRVRKGRALIYAYRPNALEIDLTDLRARELLAAYGYTPEKPDCCVVQLMRRLQSAGEFPHEIGLFLSYLPEDIRDVGVLLGQQKLVRQRVAALRHKVEKSLQGRGICQHLTHAGIHLHPNRFTLGFLHGSVFFLRILRF